MRWTDLKPEVLSVNASELFRRIDGTSVIAAMVNLGLGASVFCVNHCLQSIRHHVSAHSDEVGGLLLGRVFDVAALRGRPPERFVLLTAPIPSEDFSNSRVSLRMGTEVWLRASAASLPPDTVVGWYHSHPGLGAFFSSTDHATHEAFFTHDYAVALVVDPVREQLKIFRGPSARPYSLPLLMVHNELAVA
jgi:proteasome lid subunit RPN8/RPN11